MLKGKAIIIVALSLIAGSIYSVNAYSQASTQYPFCLQGDDYPGWSNCTSIK